MTTTSTTKLVTVVIALAVSLLAFSVHASHAERHTAAQCLEKNVTCTDGLECCGGMQCIDYLCAIEEPTEDCDETLHAALFAAKDYDDRQPWVSVCESAGTCTGKLANLTTKAEDSDEEETVGVLSVNWSADTAVRLFDAEDCGGTSILVYSSAEYNAMLGDGSTRRQGFIAGGVPDLTAVCKYQRCGYEDTVNANKNIKFEKCECQETWGKSVRSYRILSRPADV